MTTPTGGNANFTVSLDGKAALVTGAASGIGYAIARALRQSGARVWLNDLDEQRARQAAEELDVEPCVGNITDPAFLAQIQTLPVDILVNNAGFQRVLPLEEFPPEVFRQMLEVMLVAPFLLSQQFAPGMKTRGFGRIINIGSIHSKIASAYKLGYVSAKHGLLGLTRALALELAPEVTVNAICPGYVDTPLVRNQLKDLAVSHHLSEEEVLPQIVLSHVPMKRLLSPDEIGALALFLCSDAARSITAQGYTIDGGMCQI